MTEEMKKDTQEANATGATQPADSLSRGGKMFTQEDVDRIVKDRLTREREKVKEQLPAAKDETTQATREDAEKKIKLYADQVNDLLIQVADYKTELARLEVAHKYGIPAELIARLRGRTKEELDEDALRLLSAVESLGRKRTSPAPLKSYDSVPQNSKTTFLRALTEELTENI